MFSLRLVELPMPTGSREPDVLLGWILDSFGLVRRRSEQSEGDERFGALHKIMMHALLPDPLRGWDSNALGDVTGLSNTGIHHQMTKLRDCGLVAAQVEGKWHRYVLRGGSISAAVRIVEAQAKSILALRLQEMADLIEPSETRMKVEQEGGDVPFSIRISEPGPRDEGFGKSRLISDLGLAGGARSSGDSIALDLFSELCSSHNLLTLLSLSERLSESRGRITTVIDRMRGAGIVDRAPMVERIPQDIFSSLMRQFDARGPDWLMTKGGLGRIESSISRTLVEGAQSGSLDIETVTKSLGGISK